MRVGAFRDAEAGLFRAVVFATADSDALLPVTLFVVVLRTAFSVMKKVML